MNRFNSTLRLEVLEDRRVLSTLQPIGSNNFSPAKTLICEQPDGDLIIDPAYHGHGQFQTGFESSSANGQLMTDPPSSGPVGSQVGYPSVNGLLMIDPAYHRPVGSEVERPSANAAVSHGSVQLPIGSDGCGGVTRPATAVSDKFQIGAENTAVSGTLTSFNGPYSQAPIGEEIGREMEPTGLTQGASAESVEGALSALAVDDMMVKPVAELVAHRPTQSVDVFAEAYHDDLSSRPTAAHRPQGESIK